MPTHYNDNYTSWHDPIEEFGAKVNLAKFSRYIEKNDIVLDFGAGSGCLLEQIECKEKWGVDINEENVKRMKEKRIWATKNLCDVRDYYFDVIVSNHALEHCKNVEGELDNIKWSLKEGGKFICCVPFEGRKMKWKPYSQDAHTNNHLYTWNADCLGNLFHAAGFKVLHVSEYKHTWPPGYKFIYNTFGRKAFNFCSRIWWWINRNYRSQFIIVAEK